jgi:hypothetical protein
VCDDVTGEGFDKGALAVAPLSDEDKLHRTERGVETGHNKGNASVRLTQVWWSLCSHAWEGSGSVYTRAISSSWRWLL